MNTFTKLQEKWVKIGRRFNLLEVVLFELYLMVAGFLLVFIFPSLINVSIFIYLIIFLLGWAFILKEYISKNKNITKRWERKWFHIHLLKDFWYVDFAIYKLTIVVFGILLIKVFPFLLDIHFIIWYTLIFGIGFGYFIAKIFGKEKK